MESIGTPPPPHGSIFTPLLISMVGILGTSLVVVVYHLVIVKYCLRRQADPRPLLPAPSVLFSTGVDAKILETIPILSYSKKKGLLFHADQSECAVCLAELEDDDIVRLLPSCHHAFHITCIDEWFVAHTNCPVCRSPVTAEGNGFNRPTAQFQHQRSNGSDLGLQLRHWESCVLPMDGKPRPVMAGLKRSLSMGQSYVIPDIQRESERASSSSSSKAILGRSRSYKARSMRQLDRASSTLRRSFSRLRMGLSGRANQILPY
ncbi:hypothetical protein PVL29_010655 [Vitis rotundifolia]|uniref:RING-type E3 ubiquitin transferase n=1 Tax=Vitis rotundifolia TaxID=103349 RepID=A0AA38ZVU1_VITRO|nr:hypothetical protein PVL29_010655 [Vitis rotundifolia]